MPDLVLRIVQDQRDVIELVGAAQARDEALEQLRQRAGAQQLQLALLRLAQQRVVAADLLGERSEAGVRAPRILPPPPRRPAHPPPPHPPPPGATAPRP